mmetsp:Transcript_15229/g.36218  ORF Transcript_15229/g.36218 Transcript_15229/m.36218 type:complete len:405 (-) Transcript_15229:2441-3655(-)
MVRRTRRVPGAGRSAGCAASLPASLPSDEPTLRLPKKPSSCSSLSAAASSSSVGPVSLAAGVLDAFAAFALPFASSVAAEGGASAAAAAPLGSSTASRASKSPEIAASCRRKISWTRSEYCCSACAVVILELRANRFRLPPAEPLSWGAVLERSLIRRMSAQRVSPSISCLVTPSLPRIFSASSTLSLRRSALVPVMLPASFRARAASEELGCRLTSLRKEKPWPRPVGSPFPTRASWPRPSRTASTKLFASTHGVICSSDSISLAASSTPGSLGRHSIAILSFEMSVVRSWLGFRRPSRFRRATAARMLSWAHARSGVIVPRIIFSSGIRSPSLRMKRSSLSPTVSHLHFSLSRFRMADSECFGRAFWTSVTEIVAFSTFFVLERSVRKTKSWRRFSSYSLST